MILNVVNFWNKWKQIHNKTVETY